MPGFLNYKKWCTRLTAASNKVYQLLAHGRWSSPGTPASSTTITGRHDIAEILLKVALNTKNQSIINFDVLDRGKKIMEKKTIKKRCNVRHIHINENFINLIKI